MNYDKVSGLRGKSQYPKIDMDGLEYNQRLVLTGMIKMSDRRNSIRYQVGEYDSHAFLLSTGFGSTEVISAHMLGELCEQGLLANVSRVCIGSAGREKKNRYTGEGNFGNGVVESYYIDVVTRIGYYEELESIGLQADKYIKNAPFSITVKGVDISRVFEGMDSYKMPDACRKSLRNNSYVTIGNKDLFTGVMANNSMNHMECAVVAILGNQVAIGDTSLNFMKARELMLHEGVQMIGGNCLTGLDVEYIDLPSTLRSLGDNSLHITNENCRLVVRSPRVISGNGNIDIRSIKELCVIQDSETEKLLRQYVSPKCKIRYIKTN